MNKIYLSILAILTLLSFNAFAQDGKDLNAKEFSIKIKNNLQNIQLVDVRTPGEFNSGHIKNAENIDFNDRRFLREVSSLNKNKPTYIYCRSGGRSASAMQAMLVAGFSQVYNLNGGIKAWKAAKLPITGSTGSQAGLTMDEFKNMVNKETPVLVDFTATWCGPCKLMKPDLVRLTKNYSHDVKVIYIDVDQNKDLVNEIGIKAMPTLHLYKKGRLVRKQVGMQSYAQLKRFIR